MKKYCLLLLLTFVIPVFSQHKVDTLQVVSNNTNNAQSTLTKPYVIYISIDGFRYNYMDEYQANNMKKIAENGVWAKNGMYPSFPSITFPNHYTLVTGLYPAHHGIVDNVFYDPQRDQKYIIGTKTNADGSWYGGNPIWSLAEQQGVKAASLFWVGSESNAGDNRPSYYYHYHEKFDYKDKARIIKNWLQLPEEKRPHLITVYFPEVDHAGHEFGPDSPETEKAVHYIDSAIQYLTQDLKSLNLPINYILVSDHGMAKVEGHIQLPKFDKEKYTVIYGSSVSHITAKNKADILPLYKQLKYLHSKDYKVYLATKMPRKYHYSAREDTLRRIGDIVLLPVGLKTFVNPHSKRQPPVGMHGYDPHKFSVMKATFFAWGPAFNEPKIIPSFTNIDVYPLIAKILNLNITQPIDGNLKPLKKILKK